jgi:CheY-like chemotaxis protein
MGENPGARQDDLHRCSVLIVDGDPSVRELLLVTLQAEGYLPGAVSNGREAMRYLRSHAETCIILLELDLPLMDGPQFRTLQLRDRSLAWVPVVAMSAMPDADRRARDLGVVSFVRKPLNLDQLGQMLRRIGCCRMRRRAAVLEILPSLHPRAVTVGSRPRL